MNEKVESPLIFEVLSTELILEILSHLSVKELGILAMACNVFNQLANDNHLWREKVKHDAYRLYEELSKKQEVVYKFEYKQEQNRKLAEHFQAKNQNHSNTNYSWFSFFSSYTTIEPEEETAIEIMGFFGM